MKHTRFFQLICIVVLVGSLAGCDLRREDIGPYQSGTQTYALTGFDRIDMGSAFTITVLPATTFSILAEGDRRNLDDLDVYVRNGTLFAQYRNYNRSRQYGTSFTITMPTVRGVSFSGASQSTISGFTNLGEFDIDLSGASKGQYVVQAARTTLKLSGASNLQLTGSGTALSADLSGASVLQSFAYPVTTASIDASGASKANVNVAASLVVDASGASNVRYRGTPAIQQRVSGASSVQVD